MAPKWPRSSEEKRTEVLALTKELQRVCLEFRVSQITCFRSVQIYSILILCPEKL
jgi:hypothetical protein